MALLRRITALFAIAIAASLISSAAVAAGGLGDPLKNAQWGLSQIRAEEAWTRSEGTAVTIAIVDAGVDLDHPDLATKVLPGATFLGCGQMSCGNGDWQSGPANRRQFDSGHGTHVAGIAAAATGNGVGIAGVAPEASILPIKVLDGGGGSFDDVALGIRWAVAHGADVINLSLGANPGVQALTFTGIIEPVALAVADATSSGVVVVAAAGNLATPLCDTPAFDAGALCVAATDKRGLKAAYSALPIKPDLTSVAAPGGSVLPLCGEDIVSTVPPTGKPGPCGYGSGYDELAGTSMASPHVAGVAALLRAQGRGRDEIVSVLKSTSRQPGGMQGVFSPAYGWGVVDAAAAVAAPRSY